MFTLQFYRSACFYHFFLFSFFLFPLEQLLTTRRITMNSNDYFKCWRSYCITGGRRTAKGTGIGESGNRGIGESGSRCLTSSNPRAIKFSRSVTLSSLSSETRGILEFLGPIPDTKKIKQIDVGKLRFVSQVRDYLIIEMLGRVQRTRFQRCFRTWDERKEIIIKSIYRSCLGRCIYTNMLFR